MRNWKEELLVMGTKFSALAIVVASVLAPVCRNNWYEPKKPDNLDQIFKK